MTTTQEQDDPFLQLTKENSRMKGRLQHYREKISKYEASTKQMSDQLLQYEKENENLRNENLKLRSERWNDIRNILKENQDLSVEVEDRQMMFQQLTATNKNLWFRYDEKDSKVMDLEEKCQILKKEILEVNTENECLERLNFDLLKENRQLEDTIKRLRQRRNGPIVVGVDKIPINPELQKLPYYYGYIGRKAAENLLCGAKQGEYIIRNCELSMYDFTISLRSFEKIKHYLVRQEGTRLFIGNHTFECWEALMKYYSKKPIQIIGSRAIYLSQPYNPPAVINI